MKSRMLRLFYDFFARFFALRRERRARKTKHVVIPLRDA